ncbi:MAG: hypothetical protein ACE14V_05855 [bacterium]
MDKGKIFWIRIISSVCILFGLQYLGASILFSIIMGIKEFAGFSLVFLAYFIIYTIGFIAGGIGLWRLRQWGKGILMTIFSIDIITYMLAMIFMITKLHPALTADSWYKPFGAFYAVKVFIELILLVSLSRMNLKNIFISKTPDDQSIEEIPVETNN